MTLSIQALKLSGLSSTWIYGMYQIMYTNLWILLVQHLFRAFMICEAGPSPILGSFRYLSLHPFSITSFDDWRSRYC